MRDLPGLLKELVEHVEENKKWWLIPVILALVIVGLLVMSGGNTSVPVFVYPMI